MSLINDALKKAQRERGDTPSVSNAPMPGGGNATAARASAKGNAGPNPQFLLLGAGALLGVLVALGAVFWLRSTSTPAAAPSPATVARTAHTGESPATTPAATSPAPVAVTPPAPAATKPVEFVPTVKTEPPVIASATPAPTASPASAAVEPLSTTAIAPTPVTAPLPTPATAPVVHSGPPAPSPRMVEAIEGFRVTGIRAALGADAKVLMNDRVFRLGDTVDHALGIKLIAATPNSLTFRDATGATYTRNF